MSRPFAVWAIDSKKASEDSLSGILNFLPNTLTSRLFILSSVAALVGVLIVAFVISAEYRRNAEARLDEVLVANIFNLMGTFEIDQNGELMGLPDLGDSRYNLFDSGYYWSVQRVGNPEARITSISLSDQKIEIPDSVELDQTFQRSFQITDKVGQQLQGLEAQVFLGEGEKLYSFRITANKSFLNEEISGFRQRLWLILSFFAFSIVLATYLLVRLGLKPISKAVETLGKVRTGEASRIDGEYPDEIEPLITQTNALIESNNTIVERARTQVGNLAHSLKTPLAVMQNELSKLPKAKQDIFREQVDTMRSQVQVYLDRARISARSSTSIANTELFPVLEKLSSVVAKLNKSTDIDNNFDDEGLIFEGEEHDLQEIFGNLIENAAKYASSSMKISAGYTNDQLIITVEDDGEGMSEDDIKKAEKRGGRVDEGKVGWGLGLSIVRDIVDEYEGDFKLSKSDMGGLKAVVFLPGRKTR